MSRAREEWKSAAFRANIVKQIGETREACQCYIPLQKSNEDLENLIFSKARHRAEYCALVARLILFMRNRAAGVVKSAQKTPPPLKNGTSDKKSTTSKLSPLSIEPPPYSSSISSSSCGSSDSQANVQWNSGGSCPNYNSVKVKQEPNVSTSCVGRGGIGGVTSGALTCQKMLSSIITVVSSKLGPQRQQIVRDLVQELVDGQKTVDEFTDTLPKLLRTAPQPYLGAFLKGNLENLRKALTAGKLQIEGIHTPLPERVQHGLNGNSLNSTTPLMVDTPQSRMTHQLMQTLARSMNCNGVLTDEAIIARLRQSLSKTIAPSPVAPSNFGQPAPQTLPQYSGVCNQNLAANQAQPPMYNMGYGGNQGLLTTVPEMNAGMMNQQNMQSLGMMPAGGHNGNGMGGGGQYVQGMQAGLAEGAQGLLALSGQNTLTELGISSFLQETGLADNQCLTPPTQMPVTQFTPVTGYQDNCVVQMDGNKTLTDLSYANTKPQVSSSLVSTPLSMGQQPLGPTAVSAQMAVLPNNATLNGNAAYWDYNSVPANNFNSGFTQMLPPLQDARENGMVNAPSPPKRQCSELSTTSLENFLFGDSDFPAPSPQNSGQS